MNRHQFNGSNPQLPEIINYSRVCKRGIGAANVFRNMRMEFCKTLHVQFVDNCFMIGNLWKLIFLPIERRIDHNTSRHKWHAVLTTKTQICIGMPHFVAKQRIVPMDGIRNCLGVRIDEKFIRIKPMSMFRFITAIDPVAIQLTWLQTRNINMPHMMGSFIHLDSFRFILLLL